MYVDTIMVHCNGKIDGLNALIHIFTIYSLASRQCISDNKSILFSKSISYYMLNNMANSISFKVDTLPFHNSGVQTFEGRQKNIH